MLIMQDGEKKWNEKINTFAPGKLEDKSPKWYDGQSVQKEYGGDAPPDEGCWVLPKNFCPSCGRKDWLTAKLADEGKTANPGMFQFEEPHPEIDCVPGTVVIYFTCFDCARLFSGAQKACRLAAEIANREAEAVVEEKAKSPILLSMPGHRVHEYLENAYQEAYMQQMEKQLESEKEAVEAGEKMAKTEERIVEWIKAEKLRGEIRLEKK